MTQSVSDPAAASAPQHDAARLALVARFIDLGVVIYGPEGLIEWVNEAFVRMSGFSAEEVVGHRRVDFIHGPAVQTEQFARLAVDLAAGRGSSMELVTRTRQGTPYWVQMDIQPVFEEGRVASLVGIERDVTARRQAEVRAAQSLGRAESLTQALKHEKHLLSTILGTIPYVIWLKNSDLRFVTCNQAYLRERGIASEAEVVGRREDQLQVRDHWGATLLPLEQQVVDTARPVTDRTVHHAGPHDRPRTLMVSLLPQTERGEAVGVIGIGVDITQVTEMQRQLSQANRLESIGQLAAGVAHEINTPIQYIADNTRFVSETFDRLLRDLGALAEQVESGGADPTALTRLVGGLDLPFLTEEVPNALGQSLEGLERVAEIVRALKDFSHPGKDLVDTEINRIVAATVQVTRNEWKYVADLETDLDPATGAVPCYQGELKQVLLNLVVNAAQSIGERLKQDGSTGQGRIVVRTRRTGQEVLISVSDDGTGIPDDIRERIFDPFFTTKDVGHGTGQGLALAQASIVGRHGGRIDVGPGPGRGATFTVALPVQRPVQRPPEDGA
jgi:two-component system, NtrC family, sensor kinase